MLIGQIECRHCGSYSSLGRHARDHKREPGGPPKPLCLAISTRKAMSARGYTYAGRFRSVLDLAGITQWVPACRFEWKPVHGEPDPDTGEIPTKWVIDDLVEYVATCPMWAWKLARNLTRDRDLARRLGYVQTRKLVKLVTSKGKVDQEWAACNKAKSVPIEVRAAIIRAAAVSEMARTMIEDDPEAAALILRGAMT